MFGHLVVQQAARRIGRVRLPVHAGDARCPGLFVHALNQCAPKALAARGWVGEQVLQVTGEFNTGGALVIQVVGQPQQLPVKLCHQRKHGFRRV